jgi:predicted house-cleaning noncanonical NTP pyrophosphatase (MazG superfamily)
MTSGKLVRDRIPEIIAADGRRPDFTTMEGEALLSALQDKLLEEHSEFLAAASASAKCEELADLVEVIVALAAHHGYEEDALMEVVARKRAERGGFTSGIFYKGDL